MNEFALKQPDSGPRGLHGAAVQQAAYCFVNFKVLVQGKAQYHQGCCDQVDGLGGIRNNQAEVSRVKHRITRVVSVGMLRNLRKSSDG